MQENNITPEIDKVTNNEENTNVKKEKKKMSRKKKIILCIIGALILIVAGILVFIFLNKDKEKLIKLSDEEYQEKINKYGDEVYENAIIYNNASKKVPSYYDLKDVLDDSVDCGIFEISGKGEIKLGECEIEGYVYNKNITYKNKFIIRTEGIKEQENPTSTPVTPKKDDYENPFDKVIKIGDLSTGLKLESRKRYLSDLKELKQTKDFKRIDESDSNYLYKYDNKTFESKDTFNDKVLYKRTFDSNIKKVYASIVDCSGYLDFVFVFDDSIVYVSSRLDYKEMTFSNKKYTSIYGYNAPTSACGDSFIFVGKTNEEKYYFVESGGEFDVSGLYVDYLDNFYVLSDGTIYFNGNKFKSKLIFNNTETGFVEYAISENDELYKFDYDYLNNKWSFNKASDKKVSEVIYGNANSSGNPYYEYKFKFKDGSYYKQQESEIINYIYLAE